MAEENKSLEERLTELKRLFKESKDKTIYYQNIAEEAGKSRLREIDQLSKLITENNCTMKALLRSEKLLMDSFNAIPNLFTVQDKNLRILISNWHGYGYIPLEERLKHPYCYQAYMNRDTPCKLCHAMEVFETGKRKRVETTDPANGITKEINIYPVLDEAVNVIAVIMNIRDITELKQAEKKKEKLKEQLRQAQKMEALGTLAGGVAHDLNNVLSGIVSYPDLLLMQIPDNSPLKKLLLTIKESGNKAAAIVQDLLTMARRGVPVKEVVNLNDIIDEYQKSPEYENLKSFYPNIKIETRLNEDLLNITGSPVHLYKTIMNLTSNAVESICETGKITISTENRYIDKPINGYDYVDEGDYIVFTISDTGSGISNKDIGKIFEPFYTKKKMGRSGTGLGMAVVWGAVKDHDGYIDVQSILGHGTTFTLFFPITRQVPAEKNIVFSIQNYMSKGELILVVDDVKQQREITSTILKELGYGVTTVSSGEEAVEYLSNNPVDLLVLDMIMNPGIDGLDTYRQILKLHPQQKAIITSGFSETGRTKEAQKLGAGQYIKKPYTFEKIGVAVRTELDQE